MKASKRHSKDKRVITGNEFCWYIPGFPAKQGTAQLFTLCVCLGPPTVLELVVSTFGTRYLGEGGVRFSKRDNDRS